MPSAADTLPLPGRRGLALFAAGFRPFFLGAGLYAVASVATWLAVMAGAVPWMPADPVAWHRHEMLYGFVAAAIAGFLLTAVPNWTGARGHGGPPLAALAALWLAGRVAMSPFLPVPPLAAALIDTAFLPALAALVLPSIVRAGNRRNYVFIGMLALLTVGCALFHAERLGLLAGAGDAGKRLALGIVLLMVALIGGRIVPSFTSSALRRDGSAVEIAQRPWLDRAALGLLVLLIPVGLLAPDSRLEGAVAAAAAGAHALRLSGWHGLRTLNQPILWVLHLGYAWVPAGLLLQAAWLLGGLEIGAAWAHAVTIGAFSTMILAVMSRASLGHTGRALVVARPVTAAYLLITLAALSRLAAPLLPDPQTAFALSGLCWTAAFVLYCIVYAPILLLARADGRPG
ncbi:NnrS family protein [Rhodospirillum centenum]|uniref:NnrS protein n=1 Tax=Rhodospirillum centenum (strain ATCC 51521 / SW) TaxID=414684 RepID=B6IYE5_RHOCS|nr:NnrS family protein [Rhodospirillum centenum]ACJ01319.1 NnrS protein [Rhodospirillum centenum SW]